MSNATATSNHDISVEIDGTQGIDGDVTRNIMVIEGEYERLELSSAHARERGGALIAAADETEQMASYDTK